MQSGETINQYGPPPAHSELEEAIKHVTSYDDCQVGMLDYTKLWRLIVAARHFNMMLQRCEEMHAALAEAERFLDYFANGHISFVGSGTPKAALATVRAALAKTEHR